MSFDRELHVGSMAVGRSLLTRVLHHCEVAPWLGATGRPLFADLAMAAQRLMGGTYVMRTGLVPVERWQLPMTVSAHAPVSSRELVRT